MGEVLLDLRADNLLQSAPWLQVMTSPCAQNTPATPQVTASRGIGLRAYVSRGPDAARPLGGRLPERSPAAATGSRGQST